MWALIPFIIAIRYSITNILSNRKIVDCYHMTYFGNIFKCITSANKHLWTKSPAMFDFTCNPIIGGNPI